MLFERVINLNSRNNLEHGTGTLIVRLTYDIEIHTYRYVIRISSGNIAAMAIAYMLRQYSSDNKRLIMNLSLDLL